VDANLDALRDRFQQGDVLVGFQLESSELLGAVVQLFDTDLVLLDLCGGKNETTESKIASAIRLARER
jgi:hypothetical protein